MFFWRFHLIIIIGWHHRLNGHEFEQPVGDSEGQGSLACCSPWGHKELDTTEQLNNNQPFQHHEHLSEDESVLVAQM